MHDLVTGLYSFLWQVFIVLKQAVQPLRYTAYFSRHIIPRVAEEMNGWERRAALIPSEPLRQQAVASLNDKRFHAEGGSVFAAFEPAHADVLIPLIVAVQTISDYLDNLGDRTTSLDEGDFHLLHQALIDAVTPGAVPGDYYALHPHRDDGGYLHALVRACHRYANRLPSYAAVQPEVRRQMNRYRDMQVYKHLHVQDRYRRLRDWHRHHPDMVADLSWWEFAAAAGSTLGVFALFLEAAQGTTEKRIRHVSRVYFPWINVVHILLDYLIDQEEDEMEGDLNFFAQYGATETGVSRLRLFVQRAQTQLLTLDDAPRHQTVLDGLLGLYLSDPKVRSQQLQKVAYSVLRGAHPRARFVYTYCRLWRLYKKERGT